MDKNTSTTADGRRLVGTDRAYGELIIRHLFEQADFMPYRARVLA
jgi:hypothetical protein